MSTTLDVSPLRLLSRIKAAFTKLGSGATELPLRKHNASSHANEYLIARTLKALAEAREKQARAKLEEAGVIERSSTPGKTTVYNDGQIIITRDVVVMADTIDGKELARLLRNSDLNKKQVELFIDKATKQVDPRNTFSAQLNEEE